MKDIRLKKCLVINALFYNTFIFFCEFFVRIEVDEVVEVVECTFFCILLDSANDPHETCTTRFVFLALHPRDLPFNGRLCGVRCVVCGVRCAVCCVR